MKGQRLTTMAEFRASYEPGAYCKVDRLDEDGVQAVWYARDPHGHVAELSDHEVTEHTDGTISASPSVICPEPGCYWHAMLEHGDWREL